MIRVRIHLPRDLAADYGAEPLQEVAPGEATVAGVLAALDGRLPGVARRVVDVDGSIRPHLSVFVDGSEVRSAGGTAAPVADGQEVWVIRAVSGGAGDGGPSRRKDRGAPGSNPSPSARA